MAIKKYTFHLISDIHLEYQNFFDIKPKAPYLLLPGDIGYPETMIYQDFINQCSNKFEKVFYTSGNHEYYKNKKSDVRSIKEIDSIINNICNKYPNVHYLQNDHYDFDDLRIAGTTLWSNVQKNDIMINDYSNIYKEYKQLITVTDTLEMHNESKKYLESLIETSPKPVLIMTHHLPSYEMILPMFKSSPYNSHFASNLEYLFKKPVISWVCGHSHGFNKKIINGIPCTMNSIGYPSEPKRGSSLDFVFECDIC
jgi:predicted phosphohydrolase